MTFAQSVAERIETDLRGTETRVVGFRLDRQDTPDEIVLTLRGIFKTVEIRITERPNE